jgi:hypothetical protein
LLLQEFELVGCSVIFGGSFKNGDNGQYHKCLDKY